ncbi:MAG TPA: plasmid pRiA4b ORF-3 family protein [Dyella sp.]|uniref:plasmid pRiA4b ORF-3 family protein n=1 Tax=Dyella sp. TaxID=1869338 RepID=UPI002D0C10ED|nr:plasmid pRiA4b ORF-3 family protein [Dyella sp.]HTV85971.1 plasmid pRiA4b ORF-3 family protein [Dyella sp.]
MPTSTKAKAGNPMASRIPVLHLRIDLDRTMPLVWRRIEIPASSTFWDLHVAIQDAFGWLDYHAHEFEVGPITIGVPDEFADKDMAPGWTVPLSVHFGRIRTLTYLYDFGDDWHHTIHLEEVRDADGGPYPRCLTGENATPPEDCGGVYGFEQLKEALTKPKSAKFREMRDWLKNNHAKVYWPFDPLAFDPTKITFRDAAERLNELLL